MNLKTISRLERLERKAGIDSAIPAQVNRFICKHFGPNFCRLSDEELAELYKFVRSKEVEAGN